MSGVRVIVVASLPPCPSRPACSARVRVRPGTAARGPRIAMLVLIPTMCIKDTADREYIKRGVRID